MRKICLIILILLICDVNTAQAYWIWTPESGKWTNPKYDTKPDPQQQFDYALGFYNQGNFRKAMSEFDKLVKKFPKSKLAPEALFFKAKSLEKLKDFNMAYQAYKRLIEKYPFSERIGEVTQAEFKIGEFFQNTKPDLAIEIFAMIVEQSPYSDFADDAQYKIGILHQKVNRYKEAKAIFEKLMKNYPESEFFQKAKFQVAYSSYKLSLKPKYDQQQTDQAIREFQEFADATDDEQLKKYAQEIVNELKDTKAEHEFEIAEFYRKQNKLTSAVVYYQQVIKNYPQSKWAGRAEEELEKLQAPPK